MFKLLMSTFRYTAICSGPQAATSTPQAMARVRGVDRPKAKTPILRKEEEMRESMKFDTMMKSYNVMNIPLPIIPYKKPKFFLIKVSRASHGITCDISKINSIAAKRIM